MGKVSYARMPELVSRNLHLRGQLESRLRLVGKTGHRRTHTVTSWPVLTFKILIWDMLPVTQMRWSPLSARSQAMLLKARPFGRTALVLRGSTVWAMYLVLFVVGFQPAYDFDGAMLVDEAAAYNKLGQ